jgi:hypothetical protein
VFFTAFAFLIYVPLGYYVDMMMYRRRQQKRQQVAAESRRDRGAKR